MLPKSARIPTNTVESIDEIYASIDEIYAATEANQVTEIPALDLDQHVH